MELFNLKDLIASTSFVRAELPEIARDFVVMLDSHGEVQIDMASGKKYSVHLGDQGYISIGCLTVKLDDNRTVRLNWDQVENVWIHVASEE